MDNEIKELSNAVGECRTVSTLLLQRNEMLEEIPEQFLLAFMELRILDLTECESIKSLPACLDRLVELRALRLDKCSNLETLPPVGALAKLQVLVCRWTKIVALPQGMEKLSSLKLLDLSHNRLTTLLAGTMSCLSNLEYLDMRGNDELKFIGEAGERLMTQFQEILFLERLIALFIEVDSSACTLESTSTLLNRIKKFKKFELYIGPSESSYMIDNHYMKQVILNDIHQWGERMEWLFASTNYISFYNCAGLDAMFDKLIANSDEVGCFHTVESLAISNYAGSFVVGSNAKFDMLPSLEDISLVCLTNISCISDLTVPLGLKFSRLRCIIVTLCPQFKYLTTLDDCEQVEQLFKFDQNSALFPNLKRIKLVDCPELRFLSEQNVVCPRLEKVSVRNCHLLKKLPLTTQNIETIKEIEGEQVWWDQLEWDNDDINNTFEPLFRPHQHESHHPSYASDLTIPQF
ncbi:putative disease resistance protein [Sesamum alatum]|uniref:Disease resistance protein n=1 Tax=Sesamum alatum TaxID=300844 RepID=A0AAE1XML7_9LAMI|nr:putative disease resistance protein [Sesamum alatum]